MLVKINSWVGRFGNNLVQISSTLKICNEILINLRIPNNLGAFTKKFFKLTDDVQNILKMVNGISRIQINVIYL